MKTIPVGMGNEAIVDDEDYPILAPFKWHLHKGGYVATCIRDGRGTTTVLMHRLVLMGTRVTDHINGSQ